MGKALIIKGADFSEVAVDTINIGGKVQIQITMLGEVTISAPGASAIYYTTDGSTPTTSSSQYSQPFNVNHTTIGEKTVKAIATFANGDIVEATPKTYKLEANTFDWGAGGLNRRGETTGYTNPMMSTINVEQSSSTPTATSCYKAETTLTFVINTGITIGNRNGYVIRAYYTSLVNQGNITLEQNLELSNLTIEKGYYYDIGISTLQEGVNANLSDAPNALLVASVY